MRYPSLPLLLCALLTATPALATLGPPVKVRLVDRPMRAEAGQILQATLEIQAGAQVSLEEFEVEGAGWSILQVDAPRATTLNEGQSLVVTLRAIPWDPRERLDLGFVANGTAVWQTLDFSPRAFAKATEPGELRSMTQSAPPGQSLARMELVRPRPAPAPVEEEHVEQEDDASQAKTPRTIRVHGRFVYQRENDDLTTTTVGADGLTFRVYDQDFVGRQLLASGVTNTQGNFDVAFLWNQCCEADPDIRVEFEAANSVVEVEEPILEFNYDWATGEWHNFGGTDLDVGVVWPLLEEDNPALHLLTNVTRAWRWLLVNEGYDTPPVDVQWPASVSVANYNITFKEIHMPPVSQWKESTITHEYAHHWMNMFATMSNSNYCNGYCDSPNCGHCLWCEEDAGIAWREGFADWVGAFLPQTFATDYGLTANYWISLNYVTMCGDVSPLEWHDPLITEGFLGAALLDIMDDVQEDDPSSPGIFDELQLGTDEIFAVAELDDPSSPMDFLLSFLARYPATASELWATGMNNGYDIDQFPPGEPTNVYSTTHLIGVANGDPTPQFLWDIPTDDASGVVGYSVQIGPMPVMPDATAEIGDQNYYDAPPLSPGTFYFSIRSVDRAGRASAGYAAYGPFVVDVPDPADLGYVLSGGWDHPLVPRDAADAAPGNVHVSSSLPGGGNTYWNVAYINTGDLATATGFDVGVLVDGTAAQAAGVPSAPAGGAQHLYNATPVVVTGGRHTLTAFLDEGDVIAEVDETNNQWGHQWSWTPTLLTAADPPATVTRPPSKMAGWSTVTDGSPLFYNSHGYRITPFAEWQAVVVYAVDALDDYDARLHTFNTGTDGFGAPSLESVRGAGTIDAIVLNINQLGVQPQDIGIVNASGGKGDYRVDWVESAPAAVGADVTVTFGKNEMLKLLHVSVGVGQTGGLTLAGEALTGIEFELRWYDVGFSRGALDDFDAMASSDERGNAVMEVFAGVQGSYALAVSRPLGKANGAGSVEIRVRPTLPDIAATTPAGWYGPLVPRPAPDTNTFSVPAPASLPGNVASTYFNHALLNDSPSPAGPFALDLNLDGRRLWTVNLGGIGGMSTLRTNNWGPVTVVGGRHTVSMTIDATGAVEESDETNNLHGEQWVWSPLELLENDVVTRSRPDSPIAGWDHLQGGTAAWYNCDGLFMDDFGSSCQAMAVIPHGQSNVDLRLHEPSTGAQDGFDSTLVTSLWGPGQSDFVLTNFVAVPPQGYDVGVIAQGPVDDAYTAQAVAAMSLGTDPVGDFGPYPLGENEILRIFEMQLGAGRWGFEVVAGPGDDLDWGLSVHELDPDMPYLSKSTVEASRIAWLQPQGASEFVSFDVNTLSAYCVAVWKVGSIDLLSPGSFTLRMFDLDVVAAQELPVRFALHDNAPNPFNPRTTIHFELPAPEPVTLQVFDAAGRRIRTLLRRERSTAGLHAVVWDGTDDHGRPVASGVFLARLQAGRHEAVRKMTLLK